MGALSVSVGERTGAAFVDGPPGGPRTLPDGSNIDLNQAVNVVNCPHGGACGTSDWKLYAYGRLVDLLPGGAIDSPCYVMLLVADDRSAGAGLIALHAEAFGPRNAHHIIEATVSRTEIGTRMLSWRELR